MPLSALREEILEFGKGVVWVEAPPGFGKTALTQLLEIMDGFQRLELVPKPESFNLTEGKHVAVDEAQYLSHNMGLLANIRRHAKKCLVVCCGISACLLPHSSSRHCQ